MRHCDLPRAKSRGAWGEFRKRYGELSLGEGGMAIPKCVICDSPSRWYCLTCNSSYFCDAHACRHIATDYPEELGLKPEKQRSTKEAHEPDILIIPKDYDPSSGQPPAPLWMQYTKEPEPKKSSTWGLVLSFVVIALCLLALFAR